MAGGAGGWRPGIVGRSSTLGADAGARSLRRTRARASQAKKTVATPRSSATGSWRCPLRRTGCPTHHRRTRAPMSAPLPCWISTRPIIDQSGDDLQRHRPGSTSRSSYSTLILRSGICTRPPGLAGGATDRSKSPTAQRSAADQAAIDVGLREQLGGVAGFTLPPYRIVRSPACAAPRAAVCAAARALPAPARESRSGRYRLPRPARTQRPPARCSAPRVWITADIGA